MRESLKGMGRVKGGIRCGVRSTYICRTWHQMLHAAGDRGHTQGDVCLESQRPRRREGCAVGSANPSRDHVQMYVVA